MIHREQCNEYGPTMINSGGLLSEPRTTGSWRPIEDTMSTNSYRGIMQMPTDRTMSLPLEPLKGKLMISNSITNENMPSGDCEDTSIIHIEPVKKFSITARVVSVKKGTIKHIDRTTIKL